MYWFHLVDSFSAGTSLLVIGLFEIMTVAWIFGKIEILGKPSVRVSIIFLKIKCFIGNAIFPLSLSH